MSRVVFASVQADPCPKCGCTTWVPFREAWEDEEHTECADCGEVMP